MSQAMQYHHYIKQLASHETGKWLTSVSGWIVTWINHVETTYFDFFNITEFAVKGIAISGANPVEKETPPDPSSRHWTLNTIYTWPRTCNHRQGGGGLKPFYAPNTPPLGA